MPKPGSPSSASAQMRVISGRETICAVTSQGLRGDPNSGIVATKVLLASSFGWGKGTPCSSALSAAMMPDPPEALKTATPLAFSSGTLAKKAVVSIRSSKLSTTTIPARENRAR